MLRDKTLTYVSLFSSAGVGCFGFKQEGYHCIATNELIDRRMEVQRANHKCELDSGYVVGDITLPEVRNSIIQEIVKWRSRGNDRVDVLIATPPCQGISIINHKKKESDISRNSLVVESVSMVKEIKPRFFIFENVMAFQKTLCITSDNTMTTIGEHIRRSLGDEYIISGRILNFMNYGSNSSRTRTLMIGVAKEYRNNIVPYDLYPDYCKEKTLREVISSFPPLDWGEICSADFYHAFRTYDPKMREWIHDLKEGESAFDNPDPSKRPHRVKNGMVVENVKKNRDKYTRQLWDRFVQCVHTRNDQLAAQNTIHPEQDRVFSIRELMEMMTIPEDFRWLDNSLEELNELDERSKRELYKQHEVNIRQCLGEAVPTCIMRQIAVKIRDALNSRRCESVEINKLINTYNLSKKENLYNFIKENPLCLDIASLMRITELCNAKREENAAFYTNKFLINEIMENLPTFNKDEIRILEPSVGAGGFIPFLIKKYEDIPSVTIDVVDIDEESIKTLKLLLSTICIPDNIKINIICADFLMTDFPYRFDLAVGNPPFSKLRANPEVREWIRFRNINQKTSNLSEMFLEKCAECSDYVALVLNKTILSTEEFEPTREWLRNIRIDTIIDFGRKGFTGVSIETMCLIIAPKKKPAQTKVLNLKYTFNLVQDQSYITDTRFPYFVIYRDKAFDSVADKLRFDVFDVFRDRQITKSNSVRSAPSEQGDYVWVIKARNIREDGSITHIPGYDAFVRRDLLPSLSVAAYFNSDAIYLTPNMTYNPRVIPNLPDTVTDGSVAILIPKKPLNLSQTQLSFFSTEEYRRFYGIARNLSTQSINVDKTSVFFYGVLKND